ncbi:MAG: hypothetical protein Q4C53_00950 [Clostridia bacterium]|nr:hypothetical protein [Clostridia bacterium]
MAPKVLTDIELRARGNGLKDEPLVLEPGTILTPAAKDYIKEHGIRVTEQPAAVHAPFREMPRTAVPTENGKPVYRVAATGETRNEKGEFLTQLNGNTLVPKTDPRIAFRGKLDTLMAEFLLLQLTATERALPGLANDLGELLDFTRAMLAAEVNEQPLPPVRLLGMDSEGIRAASHKPERYFGIPHPVPDVSMGSVALRLNLLRTMVRETELVCAGAYPARTDLIEGLNRLSSCVYILFLKLLSGRYD